MDSKPPSSRGSVAGSSEATQEVVITQALKPSPQEPGNEINNDIGNGRDDPQRISSPLSSASRKRSLDSNSEDIMMDKASMDKKLERIRNVIRACNKLNLKLKLKIYMNMEAMGCHNLTPTCEVKIERDERSDEEGGLRLPSGRQADRQGSNIIDTLSIQCSFPVYCIDRYDISPPPSFFLP